MDVLYARSVRPTYLWSLELGLGVIPSAARDLWIWILLLGLPRQHEGGQPSQPVDREQRQLGRADRRQQAVGQGAMLLEAALGFGLAARGETHGGGQREDQAEIIRALDDGQAGIAQRAL